MGAGRPPEKTGHVEPLAGSEREKKRLRVILQTLSGELSVKEASARLGMSEARLHALRQQALQGALASLAPGAAGRPRRSREEATPREQELEREVTELKMELQAALVRTELALSMPHLLRDALGRTSKKKDRVSRKPHGRKD